MNKIICLFLFIFLITLPSFAQITRVADNENRPDKDIVEVKGKMHFYSGDGGFFGLKYKGVIYKPVGITPSFQIEGLPVMIKGEPIRKVVLVGSWCIPIRVIDIKRISRSELKAK